MEIAAHIHAAVDCAAQRQKIAVGEVDARRVMHLAVQMDAIGAGNAVLGDVDGQAVPLPDKACSPLHRLRGDGPADGRARVPCGPGAEFRLAVCPGAHRDGVVDVHPDEIQPAQRQSVQLLLRDGVHYTLGLTARNLGPAAPAQRVKCRGIGKGPVAVRQRKGGFAGRRNIGGVVCRRGADAPRRGHADPGIGVCPADRISRKAVGVDRVVPRCKYRAVIQTKTGCVYTAAVAQPHAALRLIEGKIVPHPPLKVCGHRGGIPGEGFCRIGIQPAALVLQGLRQIPVVERDIRLDPCRKQRIDQPVIPGKPCRIDGPRALREDARPGNRESVCFQVHLFQQCNILCPAVVAVAGDVPGISVSGFARCIAEGIPDGQSPAILLHCALDLIGCGCRAPDEIFRK